MDTVAKLSPEERKQMHQEVFRLIGQFKNPTSLQMVVRFAPEILTQYEAGQAAPNYKIFFAHGALYSDVGNRVAKLFDGNHRLIDIINILASEMTLPFETVTDIVLLYLVYYDLMGVVTLVSVPDYVPMKKIRILLTDGQKQRIKELFHLDIEVYEVEDPTGKLEENLSHLKPSEVERFIHRQLRSLGY